MKKHWLEIVLMAAILLAIMGMVVIHARGSEPAPLPAVTPMPTARVIVETREVEKIVEHVVEREKEITVEEISSGLQAMGQLVTGKYFFSDVIRFTSKKQLFGIDLGFTETSYLAGYDGVVTAGLDFSGIRVQKEEDRIRVFLPPAEVLCVDIDTESFRLFSEKSGLGNPLSIEDVNVSLVELERGAKLRAVELGLLEEAEANARDLIRSFVSQLADARYTVVLE